MCDYYVCVFLVSLIASSAEAKIAIFDTQSVDVIDEKLTCKSIATIDR